MAQRSCLQEDGWYVKGLPDGQPYPLDSRLQPVFETHGIYTLPAAFAYSAEMYGSKPCMATRKLIKREKTEKNGKIMEKLQFGDYTWKTYSEVQEMVTATGIGVRAMGLQPGERVVLFAETRVEWFVAVMGCLQQRVTVATLYTTLSDSGIVHGINETEVTALFTSFDLLPRILRLLPECPKVKSVIIMEDQLEGIGDTSNSPSGVKLIPFRQLIQPPETPVEPSSSPEAGDIAILMYTSGSTGTPKGVELSHTNILASVIGYSCQMNVDTDDRYLAFLPLAHIMELATEVSLVSLGCAIFYSSPLTLTSGSPKIMKGTDGDAKVAKPTVMNAVPLILDRIIKGVMDKVEKAGKVAHTLFRLSVYFKFWLDYIPLSDMVLNMMMFNKVKAELGGELKRLVVGGAPLCPETHHKIRAIFGVSLQVGYGSTETASSISGMNEDDYITGHCGGPNHGVLLRLIDWVEGNYLLTDQPRPRGEIVVAGPLIAKGYFKLPEETKESFVTMFDKKCFLTGDIAEIDESGCLKIIDRKKDLVKLKHGEYVSLGNAESKLKTCPFVENICVFADSTKGATVAVVVPAAGKLDKVAEKVGINNSVSGSALCEDERVKAQVLKDINAHGKKTGLSRWEIPAAISLSLEPWTPDSGLVTAALKLRRKQLGTFYENLILDMYARID
ncbi:unnamed protein product [Meganyctiphanes norvegica]|uniref:long-chain-fatty-acid--CoA ligase n=1 Tax=Meganyctiphanes norvegica TaxID=48144 RepID=A0AAV2RY51_MEGNR